MIQSSLGALALLTLLHFVVDTYALMLNPLAPDLQQKLQVSNATIQLALMSWSLSQSFFQFAFGLWGDRYASRWLLWVGPLLGIVAASCVGLADNVAQLVVLLVIGGAGIAAFHPEGAALAGSLLPDQRSRAMSIFVVGGYLGQALGPTYSGMVTSRYGLEALAWSIGPGLVVLALVHWGRCASESSHAQPPKGHIALGALLRGRYRDVGVLMAIGSLRAVASIGLPQALAYLLKQQGASNESIGHVQSWFWAGIGLGSVGCSTLMRRHWERRALWIMPLLATPALLVAASPEAGGWLPYAMLVGGACLGSSFPIQISFGQQLLHEAPRVASSLSMGVTWGLAGIVVAGAMTLFNDAGRPEWAATAFALCCGASCLLCVWLPHVERVRSNSAA